MSDGSGSGASLSPVLATVLEGLGDRVLGYHSQHGDDTVLIAPDDRLEVARWLAGHEVLVFDMLMDNTAVDWPEEEPRFEVVDHFFSTVRHHRLRVKCRVDEDAARLPSLAPVYGAAIWMERETFDMYGIEFDGHPDLRRILLYPEFQGHPLRKDYDKLKAWPLFEERYTGTREKDVIIHPSPGDQEPSHEP
jgi:NADH-quinone oxidoreductase subunit C